jgi:L-2-hydroxyglutarate oxidase LhgO
MTFPKTTDFLIVGGGVVGLTLALELKSRFPDCAIVLLEKEDTTGLHASGRNSGVLHAGFYYSTDSLKAKLTRQGNREMTEYCLSQNIYVNRCGKLVVTCNEQELRVLHELATRGNDNGVELEIISAEDARDIEPRVKTFEQALYSPTTSSINPQKVMEALSHDATNAGISILTGVMYESSEGESHLTNKGKIQSGYFINTAGLYADKIAKQFGFSQDYTILPFKGLYLYSSEPEGNLRTNIYPVPDIDQPFLGVHFTLNADNRIKIGPTAIPAFWRENYQGISGFNLREFTEIFSMEVNLAIHNNFGFRQLAMKEIQKIYKPKLVKLASRMLDGVVAEDYRQWALPGIRAQLVNTKLKQMEMDFRYEGDNQSFHVLNAVSPAFTCAFPFSRLLVDQIEQHIS